MITEIINGRVIKNGKISAESVYFADIVIFNENIDMQHVFVKGRSIL